VLVAMSSTYQGHEALLQRIVAVLDARRLARAFADESLHQPDALTEVLTILGAA
jgi:hypothetical protein